MPMNAPLTRIDIRAFADETEEDRQMNPRLSFAPVPAEDIRFLSRASYYDMRQGAENAELEEEECGTIGVEWSEEEPIV